LGLQYVVRKVQGNQEELKLNVTHQLLAYLDNDNLLRKNTINKNTEAQLDSIKEVGL
jgi:hypothetical protein